MAHTEEGEATAELVDICPLKYRELIFETAEEIVNMLIEAGLVVEVRRDNTSKLRRPKERVAEVILLAADKHARGS